MIDRLKTWLKHTKIKDTIKDLFEESIECYRISAFKASYLLSFVAFQNYLKEIISNTSVVPNGISSSDWNGIKTRISDEDKYDVEVINCVKKQKPGRVFMINDAIVQEYEYLRTNRNKCAHGKKGTITKSHVDVLWNFIVDNAYHFLINGGKDSIFQKIIDHYDSTITPPNSPIDYLVFDITNCLNEDETLNLVEDIYNRDLSNGVFNVFGDKNRTIGLWDSLIKHNNEMFCNCTIKFILCKNPEVVTQFIARYPGCISKFLSDELFCRKLWTGFLTQCEYSKDGQWIILEEIINGKYVPDDEMDVFSKTIFKVIGQVFPKDKKSVLEKTHYFDILRKSLFDTSNYGYPNGVPRATSNAQAFFNYIDAYGLDIEVVTCINYILSFLTHGEFWDRIKKNFEKESFLNVYKTIVNENELKDYSVVFENSENN